MISGENPSPMQPPGMFIGWTKRAPHLVHANNILFKKLQQYTGIQAKKNSLLAINAKSSSGFTSPEQVLIAHYEHTLKI
jgi:hypothetical protein